MADDRPRQQDRRDPDALRRRAGVRGDPRKDQHFLVDDRVLDRLAGYATEIGADTGHILEIGAGTGALTDRLLAVADRVTAVERDPDLVAFLRDEFGRAIGVDRLQIVAGDALEVEFPDYTVAIANLPYGISGEIAFRLLRAGRPAVVMFQAEFAERMVAEPGRPNYGRLSVATAHYATVEIVERVPKEAFDPQPAVESAVVRTMPRDPEYEVPDESFFLRFLRAVFTQRRKTVRNAIRNTAHISGLGTPDAVVTAADDDVLQRRPGDLAPSEFATLATLAWHQGTPRED